MSKQPLIIFLKTIMINDYKNIEDEFNERLLENVNSVETYKMNNIKYDTIDPIMTSVREWKKMTNLYCWTCNFTFNNIPVFVPLNIKNIEGNKWSIVVHGNFCSFPCAANHIMDHLNKDYMGNLTKLYEIFNGISVSKIYPSPNRHIMLKYGGYMSEENYLNTIKRLSSNIESDDNIKRDYIQSIGSEVDKATEHDHIWDILQPI